METDTKDRIAFYGMQLFTKLKLQKRIIPQILTFHHISPVNWCSSLQAMQLSLECTSKQQNSQKASQGQTFMSMTCLEIKPMDRKLVRSRISSELTIVGIVSFIASLVGEVCGSGRLLLGWALEWRFPNWSEMFGVFYSCFTVSSQQVGRPFLECTFKLQNRTQKQNSMFMTYSEIKPTQRELVCSRLWTDQRSKSLLHLDR